MTLHKNILVNSNSRFSVHFSIYTCTNSASCATDQKTDQEGANRLYQKAEVMCVVLSKIQTKKRAHFFFFVLQFRNPYFSWMLQFLWNILLFTQ